MSGYAVQWQDPEGRLVTLRMGELTAGVKEAFVRWLKPRLLADAFGWMTAAEYRAFRQEVTAGGVYWTTHPSAAVATALSTQEGSVQLNRLLFGEAVADWSDEFLWAMLKAKDANPESDYRVAFDLVWDAADPKAPAPAGASPTTSSPTPTTTPTGISAAPTGTTASSASSPAAACSASPT